MEEERLNYEEIVEKQEREGEVQVVGGRSQHGGVNQGEFNQDQGEKQLDGQGEKYRSLIEQQTEQKIEQSDQLQNNSHPQQSTNKDQQHQNPQQPPQTNPTPPHTPQNNLPQTPPPLKTNSASKTPKKPLKKRLPTSPTSPNSLQLRQKFKTFQNQNPKKKISVQLTRSPSQIKHEVRKWNREQKQRKQHREMLEAIFSHKLRIESQEMERKYQLERQERRRNKQETLIKNIAKIQQRKNNRLQRMKQQLQKHSIKKMQNYYNEQHNEIPLYKKMQQSYQTKLIKQSQEIQAKIAKRKEQLNKDMDQLKKHQEQYMRSVQNRKKTMSVASIKQTKSQFNIYTSRALQDKSKNIQKQLRRKKFQEKIKNMPVSIDAQKMREMLIAIDKRKNPLKYNYLSAVGALSDERIYQEFKDFEMNLDPRQIGNQYMRNINREIVQSRLLDSSKISKSTTKLPSQTSQKIQYKNYLPEIRSTLKHPKKSTYTPTSQIDAIIINNNTNSQRIAALDKKSKQYQNIAINGILNFKLNREYEKVIEEQEEIDSNYVKALRMRIAEVSLID